MASGATDPSSSTAQVRHESEQSAQVRPHTLGARKRLDYDREVCSASPKCRAEYHNSSAERFRCCL